MEVQEIHRGRLFDHVQLVVRDLAASQAFYTAVLEALQVPIGGADEGYFWADELFVSSADSPAAQGHPTGRAHLAFQGHLLAALTWLFAPGCKAAKPACRS